MDDSDAYEFYADPDHQEVKGPGRRRSRPGLSSHVPVRFQPSTVTRVKVLAERDGKTVSSWIRDVVETEVERRLPEPAETFATGRLITVFYAHDLREERRTQGHEPERKDFAISP